MSSRVPAVYAESFQFSLWYLLFKVSQLVRLGKILGGDHGLKPWKLLLVGYEVLANGTNSHCTDYGPPVHQVQEAGGEQLHKSES